MEILFYRHSLLSRGGDKMVISHASALAKHGHTVTIQTSIFDSVFNIPEGIIIKKNNISSMIGTIWLGLTTKFKSDIVIADIIALSAILAIRNRKKTIYFAQDYNESYYNNYTQKLFIRLIYYFALFFLKIPTISVSKSLADILKKRFNANVDVVTNGIDTQKFFYDPSMSLIKNKNKKISILLFSRQDLRKGFDIGLKAISEFKKKYKIPFEVWTVGDKQIGFLSDISFTHFGYVNEYRLREILSSSDIFLYPSRHEGFGLMILEAFACKCPVITTEAVSYVAHGETALKTEIEDYRSLSYNLYRLITEEELKEKLVRNGLNYAKENSLEISSQNFEKKLKRIFYSS